MAFCRQLASAVGTPAGRACLQRGSCIARTRQPLLPKRGGRHVARAQTGGESREVIGMTQIAALGGLPLLLAAGQAAAVEGVPEQPSAGTSAGEVLLLLAPILLYGVFSVYRDKLNPRAKLSDFLFIAAGAVIVLNILSILIFKRRLY